MIGILFGACHAVVPYQPEPIDAAADPGVAGLDADPPIDATIDGADDATVERGPPVEDAFPATVAACAGTTLFVDPVACEQNAGDNEMQVDALDNDLGGGATAAFLRFDPGAALEGRIIVEVQLELTSANTSGGGSGEIWQVSPFDLVSLGTAAPAKIGAGPLAPDQGPVEGNETITWQLPPSVASQPQVHLGVFPTSNNGTDYWNNGGPAPPRLLVVHR